MGLNELTLAELKEMLADGSITTMDIVADIASAIEKDGKTKEPLNTYISFDSEQIQKGTLNRSNGSLLGGTPVAVKDLINVKNTRTTCGSGILKDYVAPYDATAVANMRESGGVPAGKLNMDEFAMGSSNETSYFPQANLREGLPVRACSVCFLIRSNRADHEERYGCGPSARSYLGI